MVVKEYWWIGGEEKTAKATHWARRIGGKRSDMMTWLRAQEAELERTNSDFAPWSDGPHDRCNSRPRLSYTSRISSPIQHFANVRYWHLADIPSCTAHVRFWGQSGHRSRIAKCPLMTPKRTFNCLQIGHWMGSAFANDASTPLSILAASAGGLCARIISGQPAAHLASHFQT